MGRSIHTGHAQVVQKVDNVLHDINHYAADSVVWFLKTYPLEGDLSGRS